MSNLVQDSTIEESAGQNVTVKEDKTFSSGQKPELNNSSNYEAKIIIVEDEPSIAELYSLILHKAGYRVEKTLFNGLDVVEYVTNKYANFGQVPRMIVIMDKSMPTMDGITATTKLRQIKEDMKIVAVTAHNLSQKEVSLFDRVLRKPVSSKELIETINSFAVTSESKE